MREHHRVRPAGRSDVSSQVHRTRVTGYSCCFRALLFDINKKVEDISPINRDDVSASRVPKCTVPFPPDPDFVDRPEVWTQIMDKYGSATSRVVLLGMGGFGYASILCTNTITVLTRLKASHRWQSYSGQITQHQRLLDPWKHESEVRRIMPVPGRRSRFT